MASWCRRIHASNGGKRPLPQVAVDLYMEGAKLPIPAFFARPLIKPEAAFVMAQVMRSVTGDGPVPVPGATAGQVKHAAGLTDVQFGGKTGTAQEGRAVWFAAVLPRLV